MMKRYPNILLALLFAATVALGTLEGVKVRHLQESEMFYRWILAQATQFRIFSGESEEPLEPGAKKMMDRELFTSVADAVEPVFEDVPVKADDLDSQGKPMKRLVLAASDGAQDTRIWAVARGDSLAKQRQEFLGYLGEGRLISIASRFDPKAVYGSEGAAVSLSNIFFGFRQLAANFVWLQVDKYWHQGYMQRMIPLMNTCVALDPNFIDAYLLGAWHLAYNATAKMPDTPEPLKKYSPKYGVRMGEKELYYYLAIDFLKDGILKNSRDYRLYFDLGFGIYNLKLKDYAKAVKYLTLAVHQRHERWVPRQLYICMELNGQYEDARAGWEDYLARYPDNELAKTTAPRFIKRNEGMIWEKMAERAIAQAQAAENPAQAEALRAQAKGYWAEAKKVWESTTDSSGEVDSFAMGRIMRMKAMELCEQERYLEAIAILENARWKSSPLFEEASNTIMDIKIKANIPLSTSENKEIIRRKEAAEYKQQTPPQKG